MSDIISARCFGCGHTIKVPAGLGGKKARCPQCTNTINIPNPNDTQAEDIVSDADLPEVAVDNHKFVPEEGDAPHPDAVAEPPVEDPSEARRRGSSGTGVRRAVSANVTSGTHPRVQRSGTQPRYAGGGAPAGKKAAPAPSSNQGMIVGIIFGVVALIIIAFVVANKSKDGGGMAKPPPKTTKEREKDRETPKAPQYSPEDQALVARTLDYAAAINRGDAAQVFRFYTYDPEEERKVRIRATELVDKKLAYDSPQVTSVSAASGSVTFTYGGGKQKTLQWKQVDSVWMIAEMPTP
jgi:hypothetical protein